MCTVTLVVADGTRRLCCNRDESPQRPAAELPRTYHLGVDPVVEAVYPRDPQGGGTWIGVNDAGVIATVLNGNPAWSHTPADAQTRGELVPQVLANTQLSSIAAWATAVDWSAYPACRLVVSTSAGAQSWWWDGRSLTSSTHAADESLIFVSSGLGDALVEGPRYELWAASSTAGEHPFAAQDAYHRHRWADRPELSVNMLRDQAQTVSCTTISVDSLAIVMQYHGAAPDAPGPSEQVWLNLREDSDA